MLHVKTTIKRAYGKNKVRKAGLWFIDIPRTSSSSIKTDLGRHYGITYDKKHIIGKRNSLGQIFPDHTPAIDMREIFGTELWSNIFTFTFVRNPWDRMLSMYHYRMACKNLPSDMSFRAYILELHKSKRGTVGNMFSYHATIYSSADFINGENGEPLVNYIGKYENRASDIKKIAIRLGLESLGATRVQQCKPDEQHYSNFYDDDTVEIIAENYKDDILQFDYQYDRQR